MSQKSLILLGLLATALLQACNSGPAKTNPSISSASSSQSKMVANTREDPLSLKPYLQEAAIKSSSNKEYREAATYWLALYQENPGDLNFALQCAYNMRYANSPGDAINVLNDALRSNPGNAALLAERAKSYAASGNAELALADITKASEAPNAEWPVHSAHGVILDRLGRSEEARLAYEKALKLSPDNPVVLNNLALNHALAGHHEEAVALLQRATRAPNANIQIRQNLSLLLAMHGDVKGASQLSQADLPNNMAQNNMAYFESLRLE